MTFALRATRLEAMTSVADISWLQAIRNLEANITIKGITSIALCPIQLMPVKLYTIYIVQV